MRSHFRHHNCSPSWWRYFERKMCQPMSEEPLKSIFLILFFFYIVLTQLTTVSLFDSCTMRICQTPVLFYNSTVLIETYFLCFIKSVNLKVLGKLTSRAQKCSPNCLHH